MIINFLISYDLDKSDNHENFKKELISFTENIKIDEFKIIEKWPNTTVLINLENDINATDLRKKIIDHFAKPINDKKYTIKKMFVAKTNDFCVLNDG